VPSPPPPFDPVLTIPTLQSWPQHAPLTLLVAVCSSGERELLKHDHI
jgi:hypothetical protein